MIILYDISYLLLLQFVANGVIILNIPFARQVIGFIYFTFIPGFIFVKFLISYDIDYIETILYSIGCSIFFLIINGLLLNELSILIGFQNPLSLSLLLLVSNVQLFIFYIFIFYKHRSHLTKLSILNELTYNINLSSLLYLIPIILCIIGVLYINNYNNNIYSLIMIVTISIMFIFTILFEQKLMLNSYYYILFIFSLSLLYHSTLISNYVWSSDVHLELFCFKITESNLIWKATDRWGPLFLRVNSMLSVTILPVIYSQILNINGTWIFKILYPIIFSFVPIGLYKIWQDEIGVNKAFISTFLFISMNTFYNEMIGLNRQIIAEFFLVLLLILITRKNMKFYNDKIYFIIFSFMLIVSHYAIAEIFLIFISIIYISNTLLKKHNKIITLNIILLFITIMFFWYIFTSDSAVYNSMLSIGEHTLSQLSYFFDISSRGDQILRGLGMETPPSIWNALGRFFAYITEFLIIIGFYGMISKRVTINISGTSYLLKIIAMCLLLALILIPGLSETLNMTRFYHILLFLLAPFCVIGVDAIVNSISKRRTKLLSKSVLIFVIVPYFLFQTGFVYEIVKVDSWSVSLSKYRMDQSRLMSTFAFVNDFEVRSALWLNEHIDVQDVTVNTGWSSAFELLSYGGVGQVQYLLNTTKVPPKGVIYLDYINVIEGVIFIPKLYKYNTSDLIYIDEINNILSTGGTELYISK